MYMHILPKINEPQVILRYKQRTQTEVQCRSGDKGPPYPSDRILGVGLGVGLPGAFFIAFGVGYILWRRSLHHMRTVGLLKDIKSQRFDNSIDVFLKDSDEPIDLKGIMMGVLTVGVVALESSESAKFVSELRSLITGQPQDAALGFIHYMKVAPSVVHMGLSRGLEAIRAEFEGYGGDRAEEVLECMRYVLFERAGSSDKLFPNSPHKRDHTRNGETLADFVAHPDARTARLDEAHVAALRIYTTAAYRVLNDPLRDLERVGPHPFPVTIAFLREAIGKLRAVGAQEDQQRMSNRSSKSGMEVSKKPETRLDLWRGMRDTEVTDTFMQHGGTECVIRDRIQNLHTATAVRPMIVLA